MTAHLTPTILFIILYLVSFLNIAYTKRNRAELNRFPRGNMPRLLDHKTVTLQERLLRIRPCMHIQVKISVGAGLLAAVVGVGHLMSLHDDNECFSFTPHFQVILAATSCHRSVEFLGY